MNLIPGFAYSENEESEMNRRKAVIDRFNELNFVRYIDVKKSMPEISQHKYSGVVDLASFGHPVTDTDLLVWLDGWCLAPFGGAIDFNKTTGYFSAVVYTD